MIVIRRKHRVNFGLSRDWPASLLPVRKSRNQVSNAMNIILKLGAGALTVGMAITAAGCSNSGATTPAAGATRAGATPAPAATAIPSRPQNAEDNMPRVKVEEVKKLVAEGKAIIIDVRGADAYKM